MGTEAFPREHRYIMSKKSSSQPEPSGRDVCPRRYELVRVVVGEADAAEGDAVLGHAASCPRCRNMLEHLTKQRDEYKDRHPFEMRFQDILDTASHRRHRRQLIFRLAPIASAACGLLLLGIFVIGGDSPRTEIRTKGGTKGGVSLDYRVRLDNGHRAGKEGEILHENDQIQFTYRADESSYLFLVSIDERGRVNNFNHQSSQNSLPIKPGGRHHVEGSIILDDSKGPERVFGIFSDRILQWEDVKTAAEQAFGGVKQAGQSIKEIKKLPLPYPQASILLMKP